MTDDATGPDTTRWDPAKMNYVYVEAPEPERRGAASWEVSEGGHALEAYVRRVALVQKGAVESTGDRMTVRHCPTEVEVASVLVRLTQTVRVKTDAGLYVDRRPSAYRLYEGMAQCGLYHLDHVEYVADAMANLEYSLAYGQGERALRERTYRFSAQGILGSGVRRVGPSLSRETLGRVTDMARALHLTRPCLLIACWVGAIATSLDWLPDRAPHFAMSFSAFTRALERSDNWV